MKLIYLFLCLGVLQFSIARAQEVYYEPGLSHIPGTYDFQLKDGSRMRGQFVRSDSTTYLIRTPEGEHRVTASDIVRADLVGGTLHSGPNFPNGFPFRLFFMPTAMPAEKKQLYYQNCYLLFSRLDVGLTKHWSVGAGFQTLRPQNFFTLSTKVSAKIAPHTQVALNLQYIGVRLAEQVLNKFALVQGLVTVGDAQRNLTVGMGATVSIGGIASSGVVTIGFSRKITPDLTFINQNNILIGDHIETQYLYLNGLTSAGLRFNRRRHAFDTALLMPVYSANGLLRFSPLPYLSYQVRIGR